MNFKVIRIFQLLLHLKSAQFLRKSYFQKFYIKIHVCSLAFNNLNVCNEVTICTSI